MKLPSQYFWSKSKKTMLRWLKSIFGSKQKSSNPPIDEELFKRWFCAPLEGLKKHDDGDGAFIALAIGFMLFERYYRIVTSTQEIVDVTIAINKGAEEMGVSKEFFSIFWSTFRNGLLHQGTPKVYQRGGRTYKWRIDGSFEHYPTYIDEPGVRVICLNPWTFSEYAVQKFANDPTRLNGSILYRFGTINNGIIHPPTTRVRLNDRYP